MKTEEEIVPRLERSRLGVHVTLRIDKALGHRLAGIGRETGQGRSASIRFLVLAGLDAYEKQHPKGTP